MIVPGEGFTNLFMGTLPPNNGLRVEPWSNTIQVCVRETEILVEQQPPQKVLVCDHAGLIINKFSRFLQPYPWELQYAPTVLPTVVS